MGDISGQLAPVRRPSDDYDDDNDFVGGFDESSLSPPPAPVMHDIPEVNEDLQALPEDDAQLEVRPRTHIFVFHVPVTMEYR